jgi:hypothetical protein
MPNPNRAAIGALVAACLLAAPATALAKTYYVAPNGSGSACTQTTPCLYITASSAASTGDHILLAGNQGTYGTFQSPLGMLSVPTGVDVSGRPGQPMPIYYGAPVSPFPAAAVASGGTLHQIEVVDANGGIALESMGSGTANALVYRVLARSPVANGLGCFAGPSVPLALSNSVCEGEARGLASNGAALVTLTNDTIIGSGSSSSGAFFVSADGPLVVHAHNTIVHGIGDIYGNAMGGYPVTVTLDHSDYSQVYKAFGATVTPAGTSHNITAAPQFVNASGSNYREPGTSPTIDRGDNAAVGGGVLNRDLVGTPRLLPGHPRCGITGAKVADIGAYELKPKPPFCPISFGKPVRDANTGTAELPVHIRGPGKLVLSGANVHTVSRAAKQSGTIDMLVNPSGAATTELLHTGHATVTVKVHYTPNGAPLGGTASSKTTQVSLILH